MLTVVGIAAFCIALFSLDFAYRIGLSKSGDNRHDIREAIFIDAAGFGIFVGTIVGVGVVRGTGLDGEFAQEVVIIGFSIIGFFAVGLVGDEAIARFFGAELPPKK